MATPAGQSFHEPELVPKRCAAKTMLPGQHLTSNFLSKPKLTVGAGGVHRQKSCSFFVYCDDDFLFCLFHTPKYKICQLRIEDIQCATNCRSEQLCLASGAWPLWLPCHVPNVKLCPNSVSLIKPPHLTVLRDVYFSALHVLCCES